jgi:outer membrane protein TolC
MRSLGFLLLFPLVFSSPDLFSGEKPSRNSSPANYLQVREKLRHIEIRLEGLQQKLDSSKQQGVDLTNQPEPRGTKPIPAPPALSIDPNTTLRQVEDRLERLQQRLDSSKQQGGDLTNQPESRGTKPITPSLSLSIDSNSTSGNEGWNLLVLRELALKNSPDILIKKAQLRVDKKGIPVLEFGYMPTVKANVSVNDYTRISQFETYSEPQPYSTFSYGIESRWVLYDGYKTRKGIKTAEQEITQAELSIYMEEQNVLRALTSHFFNALSTQVQLEFLPQIEALSRERLDVYKRQLKSGVVDRMLINDSIRELENIRTQYLNGTLTLQLSKSEMNFILNTDESFWGKFDKFSVPQDFEFRNEFTPENSSSGSLGQAMVDIAKSKYEEIETGYSPILELIGSAGHRSRNKIGFDSHGQEVTFGLNLTLPVTDHYLTRRKLEQAREEINKSEYEKMRLIRRQQNQFRSEKLKLDQGEKNLDFQKGLLRLQQKKVADIKFASSRGIYDKSNILMEEEQLLKREMYLELTRITYIKQKYLLDLIE